MPQTVRWRTPARILTCFAPPCQVLKAKRCKDCRRHDPGLECARDKQAQKHLFGLGAGIPAMPDAASARPCRRSARFISCARPSRDGGFKSFGTFPGVRRRFERFFRGRRRQRVQARPGKRCFRFGVAGSFHRAFTATVFFLAAFVIYTSWNIFFLRIASRPSAAQRFLSCS